MPSAAVDTLVVLSWVVLANGAVQNLIYLLLLVIANVALATRDTTINDRTVWNQVADRSLPISLLVPAYNESSNIVENVRSLLGLHYPQFEVIVINDGSKDDTLGQLITAFDLVTSKRAYEAVLGHKPMRGIYRSKRYPRLVVIDKENGGKADSLNAGINVSRFPLFCSIDADSILDASSLLRVVEPFARAPEAVMAVGGTVRIANGCTIKNGRVLSIGLPRKLLPLFQIVEYLRAFLMARVGWSRIEAILLISGAFGVFNRQAAVQAGGYNHKTVGEDMEIIIRIHRLMAESDREYKITFIPEPVCWTEAPTTTRVLSRQRRRWQRGALEVFFMHRDMLFRPKYGKVGTIGFGSLLITDVFGPVFECLGYFLVPLMYGLGYLSIDFFLAYLALTFTFGVFLSLSSLILAEIQLKRYPNASHLVVLAAMAIVENFGYRQLNNFWRVAGWWDFLRGKKEWGDMQRTGLGN